MSASAPKIQPSKTGEEQESKAPWIGLSILFHALLLAWLIYLVPVKELISPTETDSATQSPAAAAASPELVREVSEQIEKTQAEEVRAKVEELRDTEKMLAELQNQKASEFSALAQELSADAPKQAADAQAEAAQAQAEAEKAQAEAKQLTEELRKATENPAPETSADGTPPPAPASKDELKNKIAAAQEQAKAAQTKARAAQTTVTQQLEFLNESTAKDAKTAQAEAAEAQEEANRKQDEAAAKINAWNGQQRAAQQADNSTAASQKQAEALQARNETLKESIAKQDEALQQQKIALENLKQRPDASKGSLPKEITKVETAVAATNARLDKTKAELEKNEAKLAETQTKAEASKAESERLKTIANQNPAEAEALQKEALAAQQKATAAQAKAQESIAKANAAGMAAQASEASSASQEASSQVQQSSLEGKSFAELYQTAVQTEKQIAEKFQNIRATQVAVQRKIPISEARKYVEIATPVRAEFKGADPSTISDAAALEKQNAAINTANQELDSMVTLSRNIAFQANNSGGGSASQGTSVSLADMKSQAADAEQLAQMATESTDGEIAVDLTGMMKQMDGQQAEGGKQLASGTQQAHQSGEGNQALPPGNGAGLGKGPGQGVRSGFGGFPRMENVRQSIPGRKVHSAGSGYGSGDKWMFLDTWYIIGPFPNPQRRNLDTKFPPESIVDLDATYQVEGNTLRWQFVQAPNAAIHPPLERPYAIYYAYTTLWFDEARDMWTATGSDDFSKVWINDLLVWASGSVQKNWKPDEGFRKVHFKKGLNRVLVRLENGQNACLFSFMLNMQSEAP